MKNMETPNCMRTQLKPLLTNLKNDAIIQLLSDGYPYELSCGIVLY
jgi:hypothetical protein